MSDTEKPTLAAKILLYLVILDLVIIVTAITARIFFDISPIKAFYPFFYGAQLALLLAALALLQLIYFIVKKKYGFLKPVAMTILLGLSPLLISLISVGPSGFQAPMIHDISTDMGDPPQFGVLASMRTAEENSLEYKEDVAEQQRDSYPEIVALQSNLPPDAAFTLAINTAKDMGWALVVEDETGGIIEAFDKSIVFGFIDDIIVRVRADGAGSRIDLRSVSRVGLSDLGVNAKRINSFSARFLASASKE